MTQTEFLLPALLLIGWTLVVWLWMYATRLPAMSQASIDPDTARHPGTYEDKLPSPVRAVSDNYNHLHEQPTLFYALMFLLVLSEGMTQLNYGLAWAYLALRIVHSLVQILSPSVLLRFTVFTLAGLVLAAMTLLEALRVFL